MVVVILGVRSSRRTYVKLPEGLRRAMSVLRSSWPAIDRTAPQFAAAALGARTLPTCFRECCYQRELPL